MNKVLKAFTLVEVLITIGIIGVVAAMTLPTLIRDYNLKKTVTQLKKDYNLISNAVLMAKNDSGDPVYWGLTGDHNASSSTILAQKLIPYLKVVKDCGTANNSDCMIGQFYDLSGALSGNLQDSNFLNSQYYKVRLANGSSIAFRSKSSCQTQTETCAEVYVDVNEKNLPNRMGVDIFYFELLGNGLVVPIGIKDDPNGNTATRCNPNAPYPGWYCAAWVIYKENMDYLKCADKLSWTGKSKCN